MIFTLKNNFWWYFIIKKTYLAKKGHFMAILGLLTDQKMPQSAEKGAQKICFYQRITLQPSKQSKFGWKVEKSLIENMP